MVEIRLYKEKVFTYTDGELTPSLVHYNGVLQFRVVENINEIGLHEPMWSEWENVPTVYEE